MDDLGNLVAKLALRAKLVTPEQYDQVTRAYLEADGRKPYGAILLESGMLSGGALTSLLHDHQHAAARVVEDLVARRVVAEKFASEETLEELRRVTEDMRAKGFDFDLMELLLKRNAISQEQAGELRRHLREEVVVCPVCLKVQAPAAGGGAASCANCREELSAAASARLMDSVVTAAAMVPEGATARTDPEYPTQLGPYKIRREVGRGGMAVVFEAEDAQTGKVVALKVLRSNVTLDHAYLARFHKEAEILERLDHPNIVRVHGIGQSAGFHYYAMDFVDGKGLDKIVQECRLNLRRTAGWIRDIARALQLAHDRGIIHRDVKPGNILVDSSGHVTLTDFGLAHRERSNKLTVSGLTVGTPNFMSPEQARGDRSKLDHRTDIYSLGTTFYNLAAGRVPFPGNTPEMVVQQILHSDPKPPSQGNHDIDPALETIILRAMEKDPERRYPTAASMADDLDRWLGGTNIEMKSVGVRERAGRWWTRHRAPLVAGTLALALGLGTGLVLRSWEKARGATALAAAAADYATLRGDFKALRERHDGAAEERIREQKAAIEQATASLAGQIRTLEEDHAKKVAALAAQVHNREQQIEAERSEQLMIGLRAIRDTAEHFDAVGSQLLSEGEFAGAALLFRRAREEARRVPAHAAAFPDAVQRRVRDNPEYRELVTIEPRLANLQRKLAETAARDTWTRWIASGDLGGSLGAAHRVVEEFPGAAEPLLVRGWLNLRAERYDEAAADFREMPAGTLEELQAVVGLAEIRALQGKLAEAKSILEKIPEGAGRSADYHRLLASCHLGQGRAAEAVNAATPPDRKATAELLAVRARALVATRDPEKALAAATEGLKLLREHQAGGGRTAHLLSGRRRLPYDLWSATAEAQLLAGRKAEARAAAARALDVVPGDPAMTRLLEAAAE